MELPKTKFRVTQRRPIASFFVIFFNSHTNYYQPFQTLDIGIDEEEEDEFFDCNEQWDESSSLAKWSSMELESLDTDNANPNQVEPPVSFRRVQSLHERSTTTPVDLDPQPLSARPNFMSR